jgi:hypothetical protein
LQKNSKGTDDNINELNMKIENLEEEINKKIKEINGLKIDIKNKED